MFIISGALIIYSIVLALKNNKVTVRDYAGPSSAKKASGRDAAKIVVLAALVPAAAGVGGLFHVIIGVVVLIGGFILTSRLSSKLIRKM